MYDIISEKTPEKLVEKVKEKLTQWWMLVWDMKITYTLKKGSDWRINQDAVANTPTQTTTQELVDWYDFDYTYHQTITKKIPEIYGKIDVLSGCTCTNNCSCWWGGD